MTNARVILIARSTEAAQRRAAYAASLIRTAPTARAIRETLKGVGMTVTVISTRDYAHRIHTAIVKRGGNPIANATRGTKASAARIAAIAALTGWSELLRENLSIVTEVNHDAA